MRLALALVTALASLPAVPACRLPSSDCLTLYREMEAEAEASADDELHFRPAGISRYDRATALSRRHLDRVDERIFVLPRAIGDEWSRIETCADPKEAAEPDCR